MNEYRDDLACIHHAGFGNFSRSAASAILATLRKQKIREGLVVDLACGSGIWARELAGAGYEVLGIDLSAAMLRIAGKTAPEATFRRESLWSADIPLCNAVTCLGEGLNYAFDRRKNLSKLFRRVRRALLPGGLFIFDALSPGALPGKKFLEGDDWSVLIEITKTKNLLTRSITSFRKIGKFYRRSREIHRAHLYRPGFIVSQLNKSGFSATVTDRYGRLKLRPGHFVFIAQPTAR